MQEQAQTLLTRCLACSRVLQLVGRSVAITQELSRTQEVLPIVVRGCCRVWWGGAAEGGGRVLPRVMSVSWVLHPGSPQTVHASGLIFHTALGTQVALH